MISSCPCASGRHEDCVGCPCQHRQPEKRESDTADPSDC